VKPSIIPADVPAPFTTAATAAARGRSSARLSRALLLRALTQLQHGQINLLDAAREYRFGRKTERCALSVTVRVLNHLFYRHAALGGSVGAGEAYIRGYWSCDDLTALIRIMVVNRGALARMDSGWARVQRPLARALHWLHRNSRRGSARNIAAHYDLGNQLYELMLDPTMAYSCGIFATEDATLEQASIAKFDAVCRKLALTPSDHLLEIGTGWGGLALYAAQHYGCRVTTTTISRQQFDYARERIARAGLSSRVTLLFEDYRDLSGRYDKLASIEMIEAVGARYLETFFGRCSELLAAHGAMLLQAITIQDQLYAEALHSVDYIQRYIFPGSFIPSLTAMMQALCRATDLKLFHLEDIGPHYARTLSLWRRNFTAHLNEVRRLGYPDSFIRMWEFYLCYCEGGFAERQLGDVQMLLTKPACRRAALALA
jgi:cyclopropane-fatty-acyl-phospholipid synthase